MRLNLLIPFCTAMAGSLMPVSCVAQTTGATAQTTGGTLQVSPDGHALQKADGTPFLWLGDTAWDLLYALDDAGVRDYALRRRQQGFNVALLQLVGGDNNARDVTGLTSLTVGPDGKARLNPAFAAGALHKIQLLNANGIVGGVVLAWGPTLAQKFGTEAAAEQFGRDVGAALGGADIVWLLGGDVNPDAGTIPLWRAVARGLREGSPLPHLISYHPTSGSSSAWFGDDGVLDFQSAQTGHSRYRPLSQPQTGVIRSDFIRAPVRPTIDQESGYEGIPDGLYRLHPRGTMVEPADRLDDYDVRVRLWQQFMSGAFGYTYGQLDVTIFWQPGKQIAWPIGEPWRSSMDAPGAQELAIYQATRRRLGTAYLQPDDQLVRESLNRVYDYARVLAGCTPDRRSCLVYSAPGMPFRITGSRTTQNMVLRWIDPRTGAITSASGRSDPTGDLIMTPPGEAFLPAQGQRSINDWILWLDYSAAPTTP